jgi:hypothetical protein
MCESFPLAVCGYKTAIHPVTATPATKWCELTYISLCRPCCHTALYAIPQLAYKSVSRKEETKNNVDNSDTNIS